MRRDCTEAPFGPRAILCRPAACKVRMKFTRTCHALLTALL